MIAQLKPALGPKGLALLMSRFEQLAEQPVPMPPRQEWQQVGWGSGGPTYAHEREESSRQWTVKLGLQDVATAMGDVDAFIAQYTPEQQRFPRIATGIARRPLAVGRPEDALIALTKATPDRNRWPEMEWENTHIDTLEVLTRQDEAQAARWSLFARCLRSDVPRDYFDRLPAFEGGPAEQRAIEQALAHASVDQALSFLILGLPASAGPASSCSSVAASSMETITPWPRACAGICALGQAGQRGRPVSDWSGRRPGPRCETRHRHGRDAHLHSGKHWPGDRNPAPGLARGRGPHLFAKRNAAWASDEDVGQGDEPAPGGLRPAAPQCAG